jgi:hypothetical protein
MPEEDNSESRRKRAYNYIQSIDTFGNPISLNFKGQETITTFAGGVVTIFFRLFLLYYVLRQVVDLWNNESELSD